MKKILKKIRNKFIKTAVLNETVIDGTVYRVIEKTSILPSYNGRRAICFKTPDEPNSVYFHSMIYLDEKKHYQPALITPQKIIELWHKSFEPKNALVLGAAGCAVPRFIAFNYPEMKTVGIEYCPEFIEMANKYFFTDRISDRFSLTLGDAFDYVINKKSPEKQDIIFVDVFDKNSIPENTFSEEFINGLYEITSDNSAVIFNLLTLNEKDADLFAEGIKAPFTRKTVVCNNGRTTLVLAKSTDGKKLDAFMDGIHTVGDVTEN